MLRKMHVWVTAALAAFVGLPSVAMAQAQLDLSALSTEISGVTTAMLAIAAALFILWAVVIGVRAARSVKGVA